MINPMDLTGRVIMVTGASSGIGRETAHLLNQLGANVVLVGRNEEQLKKTANMFENDNYLIKPFDLNAIDEIQPWFKDIVSVTGPMSGLVHSAGIEIVRPLKIVNEKTLTDMMNINVNAAFALTKAFRFKGSFLPDISSIVLISSVCGLAGQAGHTEYCATKGALIAFARSAAIELARNRIRVNCIAPGVVKSELFYKLTETVTPEHVKTFLDGHPLGIGTLQDVANAAAFLLADTGRWITGTTLIVDGGFTAQ